MAEQLGTILVAAAAEGNVGSDADISNSPTRYKLEFNYRKMDNALGLVTWFKSPIMVTVTEFAKSSFFTTPHWRYQRAQELFEQRVKRGSRRDDDHWTLANLKLLRRMAGQSKCKWTEELQSLYTAHLLHERRTHRTLKLEVECRILAGQKRVEISGAVAIPTEILAAYEQTFFDVRDRLEAEAYIHLIVLQTQPGETCQEASQLLRYFAYTGGSTVVAPLMLAYRAISPELRAGFMREIGERAANSPELQRLFAQGASQPVCASISNVLGIFGVRPDDLFPLNAETNTSDELSTDEFTDSLRHVG